DVFHDLVVVPRAVRGDLVRPSRLASIGVAREDRRRPLVVAGAEVRIPHAWIRSAVVEEIRFGVVRDPSPDRRSTQLPLLGWPGRDAEILPLILGVERVKRSADLDLAVGSRVERTPQFFAAANVERRHIATHSELGARVANEYPILHDDRR